MRSKYAWLRVALNYILVASLLVGWTVQPVKAEDAASNRVFLPMVVTANGPRVETIQNQFVWRLNLSSDTVQAAQTEALSEFGQDWFTRRMARCAAIEQLPETSQFDKDNCSMLRYTLAGKFSSEDIEKIKANGGILIAVSEAQTTVFKENSSVTASSTDVQHPTTHDTLTVATYKNWWQSYISHEAYAGVPGQGFNYAYVKLRSVRQSCSCPSSTIIYLVNGQNYNNVDSALNTADNSTVKSKQYALTEAWFRSYDYAVDVFAGGATLVIP